MGPWIGSSAPVPPPAPEFCLAGPWFESEHKERAEEEEEGGLCCLVPVWWADPRSLMAVGDTFQLI